MSQGNPLDRPVSQVEITGRRLSGGDHSDNSKPSDSYAKSKHKTQGNDLGFPTPNYSTAEKVNTPKTHFRNHTDQDQPSPPSGNKVDFGMATEEHYKSKGFKTPEDSRSRITGKSRQLSEF